MLRDSVVIVRTRPRAILLAMITMRKSTRGFPFVSHIWDAYGAPLLMISNQTVFLVQFGINLHE